MKKILITGSEGFLGKNFIFATNQKFKFFKYDKKLNGDLAKKKKFPEVDYVLHLAAFNSTKDFYINPLKVIYDNFFPTFNLINFYKKLKKKPIFIFTGTPEIASGAVDLFKYKVPTDEKVPSVIPNILNKRWSYAGSKSLSEQVVIHSGLKFIIIRPHNVYGQFQKNHFIPEFINRSHKNKIELYGWKNKRSWLHIEDFCKALELIVDSKQCINEIINIGSNFEMTTLNVAKLILKYKYPNKIKKIIKKDAPEGSVMKRMPDIKKIKKLTGWEPKITVKEGIIKLLNHGK
jgi:UDP-glucose 4-epimerase